MEYQKIISALDNTSSRFKTKNSVQINNESYRVHSTASQIKFKIAMSRSGLHDFSKACILAKGTVTVPSTAKTTAPNNRNKKVIFRNFAPSTDCINENKQ